MGLHSLMQSSWWGRFPQVDAGYSHASSAHHNASFPRTFLSARNSNFMDNNSINQWQCYFLPLLPSLNTDSTLVWHGRILNIFKFSVINGQCTLFSLQTLLSYDLYIPLNTRLNMRISKSCILITQARIKLLKLRIDVRTSMCIHTPAHGYLKTKTNNLPEMSKMTLENVSCNCSSRKILFLSHQTKDIPFHMVIHLVAST